MKTIILLSLLLCQGCTSTNVKTEHWSIKRISFLQKVEFPELRISKDGTTYVKGYRNDGGNEALGVAIQAAIESTTKSLKP